MQPDEGFLVSCLEVMLYQNLWSSPWITHTCTGINAQGSPSKSSTVQLRDYACPHPHQKKGAIYHKVLHFLSAPLLSHRFRHDRVTRSRWKNVGRGAIFARLYHKIVCPLYKCPGVELLESVNGGGTATQAFPSLSAALMMLCRTTAVSSWQVCKREPQQTALGPYRMNAKNKTEGEETERIARRRNEYPRKIQLPKLPESWIQYSIENFPSTPGHRHE